MAETMYRAPGIGLAANQVGELVQLIVVDVEYSYADPSERRKNPIFLINPSLVAQSDEEAVRNEGCLSVPEFEVEIARPALVKVQALNLDGEPFSIEANGLLAAALQHEMDHLVGRTILEHASILKKNIYKRKLKKMARRNA
jgi:peptide deformylase